MKVPLTEQHQVNKKAFTLVELMVVMAIISLLVAMLIPALSKARDQAVTTQCLNNQRQCGVASNAYAADYRDFASVSKYDDATHTWDGAYNWFTARSLTGTYYTNKFAIYSASGTSTDPMFYCTTTLPINSKWTTLLATPKSPFIYIGYLEPNYANCVQSTGSDVGWRKYDVSYRSPVMAFLSPSFIGTEFQTLSWVYPNAHHSLVEPQIRSQQYKPMFMCTAYGDNQGGGIVGGYRYEPHYGNAPATSTNSVFARNVTRPDGSGKTMHFN